MSTQKRTYLGLLLVVAVLNTVILLGSEGGRPKEPSAELPGPVGAAGQAPEKAPPIPNAGPLARPRSIEQVGLPVELTQSATPPDNPQTPEKIALGEKLFFDGSLSADGSVACATCHDPARAFTDGRPTSIGIYGRTGQRNPNALQGSQVAFIQGAGSLSQSVTLAGGTYSMSLDAAQRNNGQAGQTIVVLVDNKPVSSITPAGTSYAEYNTASFTVSSGVHTIEILGLDPHGGDNTAFIDKVFLNWCRRNSTVSWECQQSTPFAAR